jgi:hypothetical protein
MLATFWTDWSPDRIAVALGALIPLLASLPVVGSKVHAFIAGVLAIIAGPVAAWMSGPGAPILGWLSARSAGVAWGVAMLTYFGVWQPKLVDLNTRVAAARTRHKAA